MNMKKPSVTVSAEGFLFLTSWMHSIGLPLIPAPIQPCPVHADNFACALRLALYI